MKSESYIERSGCHNCQLCFIKIDYDDDTQYFCTKDAPPRPKCGSVYMKEHSASITYDEVAEKEIIEWDNWTEGREVQPWGICNEWEK